MPDNSQTKNLLGKINLKHCKKSSILINYARGEVVDLEVLRKLILDGHIAGAAIDVFPVEPEKNGDHFRTPLQDCPNVLFTPLCKNRAFKSWLIATSMVGRAILPSDMRVATMSVSAGSLVVALLCIASSVM